MLYHFYKSKYGIIQIYIEDRFIINMTMKELEFKSISYINQVNKQSTNQEKNILKETIKQLNEYFIGKIKKFTLPLKFQASPFAKRVYEIVLKTEYGKTYSYQAIAQKAGSPRAYRAVGTAMKNNPFAMIIPCHRVIKANGEYGRYFNNDTLKEELIEFEKGNS
ncbi:MAG: methylated-DNA--[protein]-cysteine S-methyltransferase [Mycoplasmatales bacterium]